jgi:hypothetical protein
MQRRQRNYYKYLPTVPKHLQKCIVTQWAGCRGFCDVLANDFFTAHNGGAKKPGALPLRKLENMGGACTVGNRSFTKQQERQGVRTSPAFPVPFR